MRFSPRHVATVLAVLLAALALALGHAQDVGRRSHSHRRHHDRAVVPPAAPIAGAVPRLRVTFMAVGQGDGALLESADGHSAMIDTGPPEASDHVRQTLASHRITRLDWVLFTHPHLDHIGSGRAVLEAVRVDRVVDPAYPHPIATYDRLLERIQQLGISFAPARTGMTLALGADVRVDVLLPHEPFIDDTRSDVNSNSIVARVGTGSVHVLFTGDAEVETEQRLLSESRAQLSAEVLKVAHHGSRYASSDAFLDAVGARVGVISCGPGNDYGHPHEATLRALGRRGVAVHRTDVEGDVTVDTNGNTVNVHVQQPADANALLAPGVRARDATEDSAP